VISDTHVLSQEDVQEDWGWKLVAGEVFRSPKYPLLLSVMIGNGSQLCAMVAITLGTPT
jgi:transmembrane 9 superfamily protein 2/4